ncbi:MULTISPECIES: shikimate dehydrogenase family protein [Amniculibacterium]|uniref:shikimate dehydrogenase family protein n=1 Tax=Amniculibacterium TaxID=2715289 RepID=UPI000F5AC8AA|nr:MULTISPECIES: shikimate dehydrogenase [Amniculibacterium]
MEAIKKLGLIGKNISYSFSKKYFEEKFKKSFIQEYSYSLFDLESSDEVESLLSSNEMLGFNVTIPYKEKVIPFLDELSPEAQEIGAVNTILLKDGKRKGYNTDVVGFEKSLKLMLKDEQQSAIVLGDGGASKAVQFVLKKLNIPFIIVSRKTGLTFDELNFETVRKHHIIVQCTPVGTFPNVDDCLDFPFLGLTKDHVLIDLIYNPTETRFLKMGQAAGAKTMNGLFMLEQQAEAAWRIWTEN